MDTQEFVDKVISDLEIATDNDSEMLETINYLIEELEEYKEKAGLE